MNWWQIVFGGGVVTDMVIPIYLQYKMAKEAENQQRIAESQKQEEFAKLLSLANCFHNQGKFPLAIQYYNYAETLYGKTSEQRAYALCGLGWSYHCYGQYDYAILYYIEAAAIFQLYLGYWIVIERINGNIAAIQQMQCVQIPAQIVA